MRGRCGPFSLPSQPNGPAKRTIAEPPPGVAAANGLFFANGNSSVYAGVTWDTRFRVVGDEARIDTATPGPLYGIPHSGHYFVTNEGDGDANIGLSITTSMVLKGAWFGRNEYYGFGAGADQVTITALNGSIVPVSRSFNLPSGTAGQPQPLTFFDTSSAFSGLAGITGYRIDRHEIGTQAGNWVADDFIFAASVPEPQTYALLLAGLGVIGWARRRRTR